MDRQPLALKSDADRLEKLWGELAEGERETFIKEYEESIVHLKGVGLLRPSFLHSLTCG